MPINDQDAADAFFNAFIASLSWTPEPAQETIARAAWRAGFAAFLDYIKANAQVDTGILTQVNPVTGLGVTIGTGTIS